MEKILYTGEGAVIVGDVHFGDSCSVWHNAVIRADGNRCTIGDRTNIQDLVMIHADSASPVILGNDVTVGHSAILHGCTIGDHTIVGMGSIVMDGAVVGKNCMIGAGSLITQNKIFPDGCLIMGSPAKAVKMLDDASIERLKTSSVLYVEHAKKELKAKNIDEK